MNVSEVHKNVSKTLFFFKELLDHLEYHFCWPEWEICEKLGLYDTLFYFIYLIFFASRFPIYTNWVGKPDDLWFKKTKQTTTFFDDPYSTITFTPCTGQWHTIVLSQYTSITLPFPIVFNDGWSSMSLYIEKGLLCVFPLCTSMSGLVLVWECKIEFWFKYFSTWCNIQTKYLDVY